MTRSATYNRLQLPVLGFLAALLAGCAVERRFVGPMPVRDQHPAQLTVVHLVPQEVSAPPAGGVRAEWRSAYTSLFLSGSDATGANWFEMDGEYLRTSLAARFGLGAGVEVGVELPFGYASGGFLDSFVIAWHDLLFLDDQGRDRVPNNQFRVEAAQENTVVWGVEGDRLEFLDVPITAAWNFLPITEERPFGLSVRGAMELPTGADQRGYGSGEVEWAVGAASELRVGCASFTLNGQYAWAGTPQTARDADFEFSDVWSVGGGVELLLTDVWSALIQTEYESSTLRNLDFARVADDQWLLWTGLRARFAERWRIEAAIGEDLSGFIAPDFTAWLLLGVDFGG